jgi:predicted MPP superfamily phosphohydrolase
MPEGFRHPGFMMRLRIMALIVFGLIFLTIDVYLYQGVVAATQHLSPAWKKTWRGLYWAIAAAALGLLLGWAAGIKGLLAGQWRAWIITALIGIYFSKIFGILFLLADDVQRAIRWAGGFFTRGAAGLPGPAISRSAFLSQAALVATAVPLGTMAFGILSGAHDYRVRNVRVPIRNLPRALHGLRAVQISDLHTGSFWNKKAVQGGVQMILAQKPDIIFFTGDLVNNESAEVADYIPVFNQLKAPLGVFSVTGNHDYGDYRAWSSPEAKEQNFLDLIEAHRLLGYDLLLNTNRVLNVEGESLAIIGCENWGAGRFSKYGKLNDACRGAEEAATKILLSHDPSHWDAQVRPGFPDIALTLSGHTHGFQFGVEAGGFKWSPSQYVYRQWAGLYTEGDQHLYVNRGFGYIGYPGRIGMPPEITVLELARA